MRCGQLELCGGCAEPGGALTWPGVLGLCRSQDLVKADRKIDCIRFGDAPRPDETGEITKAVPDCHRAINAEWVELVQRGQGAQHNIRGPDEAALAGVPVLVAVVLVAVVLVAVVLVAVVLVAAVLVDAGPGAAVLVAAVLVAAVLVAAVLVAAVLVAAEGLPPGHGPPGQAPPGLMPENSSVTRPSPPSAA